MEQRRHFAVDKLPPPGPKIVDDGLSAGDTYDKIIANVETATGKKLAASSLQRYYTNKWLPERRRVEEVRATAAAKAALGKGE